MDAEKEIMTLFRAAQIHMDYGQYEEAREIFAQAQGIGSDAVVQPNSRLLSEIYFQTGLCCLQLKEYEAAVENLNMANEKLDCDEDRSHIYYVLVSAYRETEQHDKMREACLYLLERESEDEEILFKLTCACEKLKLFEEALEANTRLLKSSKTKSKLIQRASILLELNRNEDVIDLGRDYVDEFGGDANIYVKVARANVVIRNADEAVRYYNLAVEMLQKTEADVHQEFPACSVLLALEIYRDNVPNDVLIGRINRMRQITAGLEVNKSFANPLKMFKKLKLGYLSANFCDHPVGIFLSPVISKTLRTHSTVKCYSVTVPKQTETSVGQFIKANSDEWVDLYDAKDDVIEKQILDDQIDIAFELMCHSLDSKLLLHAKRLAPIQISWIGFPISTGVAAIDYVIVDPLTDPIGESEQFYSEGLLYMPDTFLCHTVKDTALRKRPPFHKNGYITFGCFHNPAKLTERTMRMWREIMRRVPESRLIFRGYALNDKYAANVVKNLFESSGFDMDRVSIFTFVQRGEYMDTYNDVDILLDTYPFNGATTTCDAFVMGTPIISLVGDKHVSRVGLSMLTNVGLADLAVETDSDYIEKAVELAGNRARLDELKWSLREHMSKSKLTDQNAFRKNYEALMRSVWIEHCLEKAQGVYDYSNDDFDELIEQCINGGVHLMDLLEASITRLDVLQEYMRLMAAFVQKVKERQDSREIQLVKIFELIKMLPSLSTEQQKKALDLNFDMLNDFFCKDIVLREQFA